jgi:hypothetical protein
MSLLENVNLLLAYFYGYLMKLIDYVQFFRFFTGVLGRNVGCYAGVVHLNWV